MLLLMMSLALVPSSLAWQEVSSDEYLTLSAAEKNEIIFANMIEDTTSADWFSLLEMPGLFFESMCPTLRAPGDEMPYEEGLFGGGTRNKYIHTVGTVGQVEWRDLGEHSYTGIFEGAGQGIVRFSLAKEPSSSSRATAPGMGLKFLRDGMDSANLVAMYSVDGQDSWNFFLNDFTNHIGPGGLELVPLEIKFSEATNYISEVALRDWAQNGEDGSQVAAPEFPFMLRFKPTGEFMFSDDYVRPFTEDLTSIPQGSTLYEVWAMDQPTELGGTEKHIADLVLVSEMMTSMWGDKHLAFRHQDMAEDVEIRPEWEEYLDKFGIEGPSGCPMKRMMQKGRLGDN
eukprot:GFUD01009797.1.p1 GENE.GFUD01009797.1~~GFUD01009797.1.p1  ORF type:complete len:342 (+),score=108.83 GFUD01009797.1:89-1114(+)